MRCKVDTKLVFQQLFESQSSTYTYLLADAVTKEAVLIDSVIETVDRDLELISELGLRLKYVLDTHIHADHVTASGEIRNRLAIKTGAAAKANVPCADLHLKEGDVINFGQFAIKVLETPGHTDSSLSFVLEDMVFTGDALLVRGTGRTDFQGGSAAQLYETITEKLFKLPPSTKVYPAHDYKGFTSSTIEMEIKHNPRAGRGKTKEEFIKIMSELKLAYPKKIDIALPANQTCGIETSVPCVTAEDLKRRKDTALIVDVRSLEEFKGELGHIPGSHRIFLGEELNHFLQGYERSEEIVFVCRSGSRSADAVKTGLGMGFTKVANLAGGMQRWNELDYPVEH